MASFIITGDSAIGRGLDPGDSGIISPTGFLHTTFQAVIMSGQAWLLNDGTITAQGISGVGVTAFGNANTIEINGRLHAEQAAIAVGLSSGATVASTRIVNTGAISSQNAAIQLAPGTDATRILNTGTIFSVGSAIEAAGLGSVEIVNSGVMQAQFAAGIRAFGGPFSLVNTGQILGSQGFAAVSVTGGSGAAVTNAGLIGGDVLLGDADDVFDGRSGSVIGAVDGGAGSDRLAGGSAADRLTGGAGDDDLDGNAANDVLDGGAGGDLLDGGEGRDTASYGSAGAGVLADLTDETANRGDARGDLYVSIEILEGSRFGDTLLGTTEADTLLGGRGNDVLDGRKGADLMRGGADNDLYAVDNARDRAVERAGQGIDTVEAAVSYVLSAGAEIEVLRTAKPGAATALDLTGSDTGNAITGNAGANRLLGLAGDDVITGSAGDDTINGGIGGDILEGGAGLDAFVFDVTPNGIDDDLVMGFVAADDVMQLSRAVFPGLPLGALAPAAFSASQFAVTAATRIIYTVPDGPFEPGGRLLFDPDGSGPVSALRFAILDGRPAISAADFAVVA